MVTQTVQRSIMVVSGQAAAKLTLARHLKTKGHLVYAAGSGREAIRADKDKLYNLIVVDSNLPDMPVTEMLGHIRQYRNLMKDVVETDDVPVLLLTSKEERYDDEQLENLGVLARLHKPLSVRSLDLCVEKIFSGELRSDDSNRIRIGILDPEKRAREYFSNILQADDVDLLPMQDEFDVYAALSEDKFSFDILILEPMGLNDRIEDLLARIYERNAETKVLICTAVNDEEHIEQFTACGVAYVWTKPVKPTKLRITVRQMVAQISEKR